MEKENTEPDCAICLQKFHHPTQLPCGHVFCFLCVKGIAIQSKKCAMCRTHIPRDYFDHPILLEKQPVDEIDEDCDNNKYQWYYEGRNGWWKYEERSNADLEAAFTSGVSECLLLLAGTIYCVDFQNMVQIRRSDPTKLRRVKRDIPTFPSKGIAGIKKIDPQQDTEQTGQDVSDENTNTVTEGNIIDVINVSEESLVEVDNSSIESLSDGIRNITLQHDNATDESPVSSLNENDVLSTEDT